MIPQPRHLLLSAALLAAGVSPASSSDEAQEEEQRIYQVEEMVVVGENEAVCTAALTTEYVVLEGQGAAERVCSPSKWGIGSSRGLSVHFPRR